MLSIHPYGDTALLVNFEQKIDRSIHQEVLILDKALSGTKGIRYMIPAYCSLTVVFDPILTNTSVLQKRIAQFISGTQRSPSATRHRVHEIPVCYDDDYAPDLEEVSLQTGKPVEEIIATHLDTEFYVYMLGFMPGFAYMGDMPEEFFCNRKTQPRTKVPAGSVALSGRQSGIYPFETPGGWQIIGRTPLVMFEPGRTPPALLAAGDKVRFIRVRREEYSSLQ